MNLNNISVNITLVFELLNIACNMMAILSQLFVSLIRLCSSRQVIVDAYYTFQVIPNFQKKLCKSQDNQF